MEHSFDQLELMMAEVSRERATLVLELAQAITAGAAAIQAKQNASGWKKAQDRLLKLIR